MLLLHQASKESPLVSLPTHLPTYLPTKPYSHIWDLPDQDNRSKENPPPSHHPTICIVYPCSPTKVHWCQSACTEKTKVKLANCTQKHGIRRFMVFRFPKAKDFQHTVFLARMWTSTQQLTMQDEWMNGWMDGWMMCEQENTFSLYSCSITNHSG
jgi:hypothetical protein